MSESAIQLQSNEAYCTYTPAYWHMEAFSGYQHWKKKKACIAPSLVTCESALKEDPDSKEEDPWIPVLEQERFRVCLQQFCVLTVVSVPVVQPCKWWERVPIILMAAKPYDIFLTRRRTYGGHEVCSQTASFLHLYDTMRKFDDNIRCLKIARRAPPDRVQSHRTESWACLLEY